MLSYDVLVIGSGGTGLRAALAASEQNVTVAVLTKTFLTRAATVCAQGGINAALGHADDSDSLSRHAQDTIKGSGYLADNAAVEFFVQKAQERVRELDYWGLPFSRDDKGRVNQRPFGGGSFPRTCFAQDRTGQAVLNTLFERCLKQNITILSEWMLLDIVVEQGLCGVVAMNLKQGVIVPIAAKAIVVATGGAGRIYWSRTTNPYASTGDGMAACFKAGIPLKDPEFIQFHPTGLAGSGILISEAARGEGGYLLNNQGERFMFRYDERGELATRDIVSQAIEREIQAGRGWGQGIAAYVQLDLRHLGEKKIKQRLPQIASLAMNFAQVDVNRQPIGVRTACHYFMGGIDVEDFRTCATKLEGIFAAGECACISIHGANRLGGNSLAETVVFGEAAGKGAASSAINRDFLRTNLLQQQAGKWTQRFEGMLRRSTGARVSELRNCLGKIMWDHVGVFREDVSLGQSLQKIQELKDTYPECCIGDSHKIYNTAFVQYIELGNMLTVAEAVVRGALARRESRGCHFRLDYPKLNDAAFLFHTIVNPDYSITYKNITGGQNAGI